MKGLYEVPPPPLEKENIRKITKNIRLYNYANKSYILFLFLYINYDAISKIK